MVARRLAPLLAFLLAVPVPSASQEDASRSGEPDPREAEASGLVGQVVLPTTGEPVAGVEVLLHVHGRRTVTDSGGRFAFEGLEPGPEILQLRFLDDVAAPDTIVFPPGVRLQARLDAPVDGVHGVEDLVVRVRRVRRLRERRYERFRREAGTLGSRHLGPHRLRSLDPEEVSRALPHLGVAVDRFSGQLSFPARGPKTILGRRTESRTTFSRQTGVLRCVPAIYVNSQRWSAPDVTALDVLDPERVTDMVIYRPPFVPARYSEVTDGCGVLALWVDWRGPDLGAGLGPDDRL